MRKLFSIIGCLLLGYFAIWITISACSKSDDNNNNNNNNNNPTYSNTPVATSDHDNNAGGVYKGLVMGSAGYVVIFFKNGNNKVYAILNFDDIKDSLICSSLDAYTFPGTDINNAVFTSTSGTGDSVIFSVKSNGTNPMITVKIPGHTTTTTISKETSTSVLKVYKGTGYDTLVKGYYYCGSSTVNTIGSIRSFDITILVQGTTAVVLPGNYKSPCPNVDTVSAVILTLNSSNKIEFIDPGPPTKNATFNVTDTSVSGSIICTLPIDLGGKIDAYNTYVRALRVN